MSDRRMTPRAMVLTLSVFLAGAGAWGACSASKPVGGSDAVPGLSSGNVPHDGTGSCAPGTTSCGSLCVDLLTSVLHCGECGSACPLGETCRGGACEKTKICTDPALTECNGACVDLKTSLESCGDCGRACGQAQVCLDGTCAQPCPAATIYCNGDCIEPATHSKYCGATTGCGVGGGSAGVECSPQQRCVDGACAIDCPQGEMACTVMGVVACYDVRVDEAHCGTCTNACSGGMECSRGLCCPVGQEACQGQCRDVMSDPMACGGCGVSCDTGKACNAGVCEQ